MTPDDLIARGRECLKQLDVAGAERAFHEAVDLSRKSPEVKRAAADAYRQPGWFAVNEPGKAEEAWRIFQNARALYESLGVPQEAAKAWRGMSIAAGKLGDYDASLRFSAKAEEAWNDPEFLAKLRNDRIILLVKLDRRAEAEKLLKENLKLVGRLKEPLIEANARTSAAILAADDGRFDEAVQNLERVREIYEEIPQRLAKAELWLASVHLMRGDRKSAEAILDRQKPGSWRLEDLRSALCLAAGDRAGAAKHLEKAIAIIEEDRGRLDTEDFRITFQRSVQDVYRRLFALRIGEPEAAFDVAERARARSFLDFLGTGERRDFAGLRPAERERLEKKRAELEKLSDADPKRRELEDQFEQLVRRYEKDVLARRRVLPAEPVSSAELLKTLADDEALVAYFSDGERLHAFAARRGRLAMVRLEAPVERIAEEAAAVPAVIRAARREERATGRSTCLEWTMRELYRLVWEPLADEVGEAARVTVVPSEPLHLIPFSALRSPRGWLAERHRVSIQPSASVFAAMRRRGLKAIKGPRCLMVRDPGGTLAHAEDEERALRGVFGERLTVLAGSEATASRFRELAPRHEVVYIASHGLFRLDRPSLSWFEVADGAGGVARFLASEVAGLDLAGCRLVVLSACESGCSVGMGSGEAVGLPRAFMRAGAASVIASMWRIPDGPEIAEYLRRRLHGERDLTGVPVTAWSAFASYGSDGEMS